MGARDGADGFNAVRGILCGHLAQNAGVAALGIGLLTGCGEKQAPQRSAPEKAPDPYTKIDDNTYLIRGCGFDYGSTNYNEATFGLNLARFRSEVSGNFDILPTSPRAPYDDWVYAIRTSVTNATGAVNAVQFGTPGKVETPQPPSSGGL